MSRTAIDRVRPDWSPPSPRLRPCRPGDVVKVWDRFTHEFIEITAERVYWDGWLRDWRIFAVDGETYYTGADFVPSEPDLLDALESLF